MPLESSTAFIPAVKQQYFLSDGSYGLGQNRNKSVLNKQQPALFISTTRYFAIILSYFVL